MNVRVVVDPVDVVADAGVDTRQPGTLAVDTAVAHPGHAHHRESAPIGVVVVHRSTVVSVAEAAARRPVAANHLVPRKGSHTRQLLALAVGSGRGDDGRQGPARDGTQSAVG